MIGLSLAPKWPIPVPFFRMDHRKSNFSLIFDILSVRGCWGKPMILFWKLVYENQISKSPKPTGDHNLIKLWILLSLKADLLYILQYEAPCSKEFSSAALIPIVAMVCTYFSISIYHLLFCWNLSLLLFFLDQWTQKSCSGPLKFIFAIRYVSYLS